MGLNVMLAFQSYYPEEGDLHPHKLDMLHPILAMPTVDLDKGSGLGLYHIYKAEVFHTLILNKGESSPPKPEYIIIDDPKFNAQLDLIYGKLEKKERNYFPFWTWTTQWKQTITWRLLNVAQIGNFSERAKAVRTLASLQDLSDWEYNHIAQACDSQTAIALAHTCNADLRFFLKSPCWNLCSNKKELVENLLQLLVKLYNQSKHACLHYLISKTFKDFQLRERIFDHELSSFGAANTVLKEDELILICIQNLLHHSAIEDNAKDIVTQGGLQVLIGVYRLCNDNTELLIALAKLLSNISIHTDFQEEIFRAGWIGILANLARNEDINISAPSVKALTNLDTEVNHDKFTRGVYLLHPAFRDQSIPKVDVVFIHGLLGGLFVTWRQRDAEHHFTGKKSELLERKFSDEEIKKYLQDVAELKREEWKEIGSDFEFVVADCPLSANEEACGPFCMSRDCPCIDDHFSYTPCWPRDWLPKDCPCVRIIGVNYDTSLSRWGPTCPSNNMKSTLNERSEELRHKLKLAGVGRRPIIWVAHSMGGLLVKNILVKDWESEDRVLCNKTKGLVFYSVPHLGSPLADLNQTSQIFLWPSVEVQELRNNSPVLLSLHNQFLNMIREIPMKAISFAETQPTIISPLLLQLEFVPINSAGAEKKLERHNCTRQLCHSSFFSAPDERIPETLWDPGFGETFLVPQDHLTICKPAARDSFLYQKLISLIKTIGT